MREKDTYGLSLMDVCSSYKPFDNRTNEELCKSYQEGNKDDFTELMLRNGKLIIKIMKQYAMSAWTNSKDDLFQEGVLGLREAVEKYNPDKGSSFATYAYPWVMQAVIRYVQENKLVPEPVRFQEHKVTINKAIAKYEAEHGVKPDFETIAKITGLSEKVVSDVFLFSTDVESLSSPVSQGEDKEATELGDTLASNLPPVEAKSEKEALHNELIELVRDNTESERDAQIIMEYHNLIDDEHHTFAEIAAKHGVSKERARQIEKKFQHGLSSEKNRARMKDFRDM